MKNVLSKLTRRVRSRRGESLIETLAAILILTMASIVLYSMITTSADINMKADAMAKTNQTNLVAVEQANGAHTQGTVTFKINGATLYASVNSPAPMVVDYPSSEEEIQLADGTTRMEQVQISASIINRGIYWGAPQIEKGGSSR